MNTNALKRFAKEARKKLLEQVGHKLQFVLTHDTAELRGRQSEIAKLNKLIAEQGKAQVIEMVAYTWFNRLMAFRFMDANGYTVPKVVTPLPGMTNPEILQNALSGNIETELTLDRQRLNDLLDGKAAATDPHTEAYKMLLVAACNQWHAAMPFMFEHISDYTELLLPDDLLSEYSIVADIRNGMSDEDCQQEELIGWLYQFYIADKKNDVFEALKKNVKITPENIPAATQLFTPRWIVRYMVENTLGKLWLTLKPGSSLRQFMPYYIEASGDNTSRPIPEGIKGVTDITFLDPCQGSGHILVYAFDLLTKIYEEEGYSTNEIPALILQHNLFGIDIDERAAQLASFALTMKARSYYTRFLRKPVQPHVIALEDADRGLIKQAVKLPLTIGGKKINKYEEIGLYDLREANNYGALIQINPEEVTALKFQKGSIWHEQEQKLVEQAEYLSRQYHCVVTNPPYMGIRNLNASLKNFAEDNYENSKNDLFATFIERTLAFTATFGFTGIITQQSWMFLSSYEMLREVIIRNHAITSLLHLGARTFPEIGGEVVQNSALVLNKNSPGEKSLFYRLISYDSTEKKEQAFLNPKSAGNIVFTINQSIFFDLPGHPFAYWISPDIIKVIKSHQTIGEIAEARGGMTTGNNELFLRYWHEIDYSKIGFNQTREAAIVSKYVWFPYNKGGSFKKWIGNRELVVNWYKDGKIIKDYKQAQKALNKNYNSALAALDYMFLPHLSWSLVNGGEFALREYPQGYLFDAQGSSLFIKDEEDSNYILGLLNSSFINQVLQALNPTLSFQPGNIESLPYLFAEPIKEKIAELVVEAKEIAEYDNSLRETSFDFQGNYLISTKEKKVQDALIKVIQGWADTITKLKQTEESINKELLQFYRLEKQISAEVKPSSITIFQEEVQDATTDSENAGNLTSGIQFNREEIINQLLSYFVSCVFGRYSLDKPGLILCNQGETLKDYLSQVAKPSFIPVEDNIIPVLEGDWFTNDIAGYFKIFLKTAFGEKHFEENLDFIQDTIGKDIGKYFFKDFYNDHIRRYKKRPVFWMFSSPKGHFKALIYLHRYKPDLCSKLLNDYLQNFIGKLEAKKQTETRLSLREDISQREKTAAIKEIDKTDLILKDCRAYEKTLFSIATRKIQIELDEGVKVNYQKFKEVLLPIKGLEKEEG